MGNRVGQQPPEPDEKKDVQLNYMASSRPGTAVSPPPGSLRNQQQWPDSKSMLIDNASSEGGGKRTLTRTISPGSVMLKEQSITLNASESDQAANQNGKGKGVELPVDPETQEAKPKRAQWHNSFKKGKFRISFRGGVVAWSVISVLIAALSVGIPAIIIANKISTTLTNKYTDEVVAHVEGVLGNLQSKLNETGKYLLELNDTQLYQKSMPWCRDTASEMPSTVSLMYQFLRHPDVSSITLRWFWNNSRNSMTSVMRDVGLPQQVMVCQDALNALATVYRLPDAFTRIYLNTISFNKLSNYSHSGLQLGEIVPSSSAFAGTNAKFLVVPLVYPLVSSGQTEQYFIAAAGISLTDIQNLVASIGDDSKTFVVLLETNTGELVATNINGLDVINQTLSQQITIWDSENSILAAVGNKLYHDNSVPGTIINYDLEADGEKWLVHGLFLYMWLFYTISFTWAFNDISTPLTALVIKSEQSVIGRTRSLFVVVIVLCVALACIWATLSAPIAWRISRPLRRVSTILDELSNLDFTRSVEAPRSGFVEVAAIQSSCSQLRTGLRAFVKYVPPSVCKNLLNGKLSPSLGVKQGNVAVMFLDGNIRHLPCLIGLPVVNFTGLTENENPEILVHALASRFDALVKVISDNGGTIDKFIGDSIMAFFNEPTPMPRFNHIALQTAFQCIDVINYLNEHRSAGDIEVAFKIGLSTGPCLVGNIGGEERFSFTVLGRFVNEAARLEAATRQFGVGILIGPSMYEEVKADFLCRELRICSLKGFSTPRVVYEPICLHKEASAESMQLVDSYTSALHAFNIGEFSQARADLRKHYANFPADKVAKMLLDEVEEIFKSGVPAGWSPVKVLLK